MVFTDYLPSIDKKNFIGRWFLFCMESRYLNRSCVFAGRLLSIWAGYFAVGKRKSYRFPVGLAGIIVEI
jgi:hypothetical protein